MSWPAAVLGLMERTQHAMGDWRLHYTEDEGRAMEVGGEFDFWICVDDHGNDGCMLSEAVMAQARDLAPGCELLENADPCVFTLPEEWAAYDGQCRLS